ncbi:hypothetical protein [Amycolatopsis sp. NPDC051371]|uniref:hypothetical protein n=1 Tax=Amycolatopsis sp. NPDC051371 TaxID=3155800 RepID=UPI003423F1C3
MHSRLKPRSATGRVVVIVGATSGIGLAAAVAFAARAGKLVLVSRSAERSTPPKRRADVPAPTWWTPWPRTSATRAQPTISSLGFWGVTAGSMSSCTPRR